MRADRGETMSYRYFYATAALVALGAVALLAPAPATGQALSPAVKATTTGKAYTPPRTPDGVPDLQGVWTNNTVTPMQRPKELAGKEFYTEAELADVQKRERERYAQDEADGLPAANHSGIEGA